MLGRYRKWSSPKTGVAFLFDIEMLSKTYGEVWRPFDRNFIEALLPLVESVKGEDRLEVWGGAWQEQREMSLFALLAGVPLPSESIGAFYGRLRQKLPEGTVVFAGSPQKMPPLVPLFGVSREGAFRCAVSVDGASPVLRLLVYGENGPVFSAVTPTPVNLAATVDKIKGVSVRVADMTLEGGAGYSEEGDRIEPEDARPSAPPEATDTAPRDVRVASEPAPQQDAPSGTPPHADPSSDPESGRAGHLAESEGVEPAPPRHPDEGSPGAPSPEAVEALSTPTYPTPGGSFLISEADVVSVQSVVPEEEPESEGMALIDDDDSEAQTSLRDGGREQEEIDLYSPPALLQTPPPLSDPMDTAALMGLLPPESVRPAPAKEPAPASPGKRGPFFLAGVSAERTLIDIGDDDITEARPIVIRSPLSSLTDSELRVILTSAPTEESCRRLGEAFGREPSEIARVFALASGAPSTSGPEGAFSLRAKDVARSVGWVLTPEDQGA